MKPLLRPLTLAGAALLAATFTARIAVAQGSAPRVDASSSQLEVASPENVESSVRKLAGRPVLGANGERLGTIKDFVIDKKTGEVVYAVVSSGGVLGAGDTLRLVPIQALKPAADGTVAFVVKVGRASWDRSPAVIDEAFNAGIIHISDEDRRELSRLHGVTLERRAFADAGMPPPRSRALERAASPWIRATSLRGKHVHASGQPIGEIDEIVIDLDRRKAAALLDPEDHLVAGDTRVLVPLTEFSLESSSRDGVATTLTRHDIARLDPSHRQRIENNLLPTGRGGPYPDSPATVDAPLASAARSARQSLDQHPQLARADIRVTPERDRLVLRGQVASERMRRDAHDAAQDAAGSIRVENELTVESRSR